MKNKKIWVAKISDHLGDLHDYELSPRFESIYDCQKYIDENLKEIEKTLDQVFFDILFDHVYEKGKKKCYITMGGSFIRCYNIQQQRFCTGFDF